MQYIRRESFTHNYQHTQENYITCQSYYFVQTLYINENSSLVVKKLQPIYEIQILINDLIAFFKFYTLLFRLVALYFSYRHNAPETLQ